MIAKRAEVPVDSIIFDEQFGRYHDDAHIEIRAEIIERYGLLCPITVDKDLRLLAGDQGLMLVVRRQLLLHEGKSADRSGG